MYDYATLSSVYITRPVPPRIVCSTQGSIFTIGSTQTEARALLYYCTKLGVRAYSIRVNQTPSGLEGPAPSNQDMVGHMGTEVFSSPRWSVAALDY